MFLCLFGRKFCDTAAVALIIVCSCDRSLPPHSGVLHPEILHSKLAKRSWPSKTVVEKRLQSFLTRVNTLRLDESVDIELSEYTETASDGLAEYPVGFGPWSATSLAAGTWKYTGTPAQDPDTASRTLSPGDKIPNVQWVYDSRNAAQVPPSLLTDDWFTPK